MSAVVWLGKAAPSALLRTALTDHRRLHECTHGQQPGTLTRPHAFTGVQRESRTRLTRVIGTAVDCRKTCRICLHSTSYRGPLHVHLIVPAVCRGSTVYISLHHDVESTSLHHSTVYIPLHSPSGRLQEPVYFSEFNLANTNLSTDFTIAIIGSERRTAPLPAQSS